MPSVFATRFFDVASPRLRDHFGEAVSLVRGAVETTGVTAVVTTHEYQGDGQDGFVTTFVFTDFVFDVADYVFSSVVVAPRKGDHIKRTVDGTTYTYEVLPVPSGRVCEWSDKSVGQWRVHAKFIDS